MISTNMGDTWAYGGQLLTVSEVGYVNGYFKYSSNGIDRIDFVCTEHHPDDYNTSIFHGYIMDAKSFKSDGTLIDDNVLDNDFIPEVTDFTIVFEASTVINDMTMSRCWNMDVQSYEDGTVATIISARINNKEGGNSITNANHAFINCRYNGTEWSYTYLGEAGLKLYSSQEDYTRLAALHPNDPNTIYISTHIDPRNNSDIKVHEIFKGVTTNNGETWQWYPITWNSVRDNLRPIIPGWDNRNTALLKFRGTYFTAQSFDEAIVGIIENIEETVGLMTYVDANTINTQAASGEILELTGPSNDRGPADDKWHVRSGFTNGNEVFASGEIADEDAPVLKTELSIMNKGTYDIWVNF